ncbi:hypothetical protein J2T09_005551 [Neorhizobium huautlense]|uniref:DUF4376 domain-containing protein n=1 Tax=Neorhizobium huautlense TaxID=67774 RepID=A0ABT9Q1Z9_9HYPH|nr:hypothetical protein [Neorhizobium huautlense]MDP9840763.1 hypothetical protein [Neorhizobium huautlense]
MKDAFNLAIDDAAEIQRKRYITAGDGQAMTYMQKASEAARYLAAEDPQPEDYPLISAEVGIAAETHHAVATIIDDSNRQWQVIGSALEAVRLDAKKSIAEASSLEAAHAVTDAVIWPDFG